MMSLIAAWCPLYHLKIISPSIALEAVVMVGYSGRSPGLMVDRVGVRNFVSRVGVVVRMLILCLFSSFNSLCVTCEVVCD